MNSDKDVPVKKPAAGQRGAAGSRDREMGEALRSVYDKAVQESVPDEMLDQLAGAAPASAAAGATPVGGADEAELALPLVAPVAARTSDSARTVTGRRARRRTAGSA